MPDAGTAAWNAAKKGVEHPEFSHFTLAVIAEELTGEIVEHNATLKVLSLGTRHTLANLSWFEDTPPLALPQLAIPEGIAELFSYRLSKKLPGIQTAEIELSETRPKRSKDYFVRKVAGGYSLSKRVEHSLPVYFLSDKVQTFYKGILDEDRLHEDTLNKSCPVSRSLYKDFPRKPSDKILAAAHWRSPERIKSYLYHALLYGTFPHSSNVLVTAHAQIIQIDFATIPFTRGVADIHQIYTWISHCPELMQAAGEFSRLTERDIEKALKDIPAPFWRDASKLNNEHLAATYFGNRLKAWKQCFPAKSSAKRAA
jgi:hypothetical protein